MGSLFRSEEMTLSQLFLHTDSAYNCISEIGEIGAVQFIDTIPGTNAHQRKFVGEIRRCENMLRIISYVEKEVLLEGIPILNTNENPPAPEPKEIIELEANFEALEEDLNEINTSYEQLKKNFHELIELNYLLKKTQIFFDEGVDSQITQDYQRFDDAESVHSERGNVRFIAGVINRDKIMGFERILWRVARGNVLIKFADIEAGLEDMNSSDNKKVSKSVFVVFFQGEQLKMRVEKICEAYHATIYPCTDNANERKEMVKGVISRMDEMKRVMEQTQSHRHSVLVKAAKQLRLWLIKVRKIKAIYHILNLFNVNVTDKCMIGECWSPTNDLESVQVALKRGMDRSNGTVAPILNRIGGAGKSHQPTPTFNRVNRFTSGFQNIVDAYGVANYREVNPTPYTIITFPFLFAVMFGDAGHGLIMFLFALVLVLREKKLMAQKSDNEIWNIFFGGRYIILLMGAFSIYTGLVYNDVFSRSLNIFGSSWRQGEYDNATLTHFEVLQLNPNTTKVYLGYPYAIGLDPVWQTAKNKITVTNSIKMKMSIILGVSQMLFGVFMSLMNHLYFRDYLSIFTEFIPQVVFLLSIFGYLIVEIFIKWIKYNAITSHRAPSLLIGLINMFMFTPPDPKKPGLEPLFAGQGGVQAFLVVLAVICIPWMLVIKPAVLIYRNWQKQKRTTEQTDKTVLLDPGYDNRGAEVDTSLKNPVDGVSSITHDSDLLEHNAGTEEEEEEFEMGEMIVHQCIHTIEYCLGCISNTASYLRLWALSLAHGQLSEVLWNMVFKFGLKMNSYAGCILIFFIFAGWAVLTIAILLLMEGLSAFLHALRLHWVEFQNKFYKGEGVKFIPFTFEGVDDLNIEM